MLSYTPSRFQYHKRQSTVVKVGDLHIGDQHPVMVQSMCTTPTQDIAATVAQSIALAEAGSELVRITAPGIKDAEALGPIRKQFSAAGYKHVPICADIHFMPKAAMIAIEHVEKVRVNPGNFADKKSFNVLEYSDAEYAEELERVAERFTPLVQRAKTLGRALRIGSNHGSLSDRIMNRFGDTPAGMVASAMEFIRIAEADQFYDMVVSMKSSNPKVMIEAYRLLVAELDVHGHAYPLHLGVTEAGDGEDARVKSACGIGALLEDGIGDTIRVSLTEDPCAEIPVARALCALYADKQPHDISLPPDLSDQIDPYVFNRRSSDAVSIDQLHIGEDHTIAVCAPKGASHSHLPADIFITPEQSPIHQLDIQSDNCYEQLLHSISSFSEPRLLAIGHPGALGYLRAYRLLHTAIAAAHNEHKTPLHPIALALHSCDNLLEASSICGALLGDGIGDAIYLPDLEQSCDQAFTILQAIKARMTRTDYVACPSCGRTLFDLIDVSAEIKAVTDHLDNVTIAIMGCIVNGPGEMADADFGYVGSGPDKITLYRGKDAVVKNIPSVEAKDRLIQLIKDAGMWHDAT